MYDNDKKQRITLRLNNEQFDFVKVQATRIGVTPSEWLRQIVNSYMYTARALENKIGETIETLSNKEGIGRENDKANINNKLQ